MSHTHALTRCLAVTALAALALTGCSGSSDGTPAASPSAAAKVETAALPSPSADATPVPTATPDPSLEATPTAEATPEPAPARGLSAARQALVDRLRADAVSDCRGNSAAEGDDVSAAVSCSGAGGTVLAFAYPSSEALAREVDRLATGIPVKEGKCSLGDNVRDTWVFNHVTQGDLVCRNADGKQVFYWSQYDQLVGFQITGDAPAGGYTTWKGFEPI